MLGRRPAFQRLGAISMTAHEPRAACCVCFRAFPEPGQLKCPDCDLQSAPSKQRADPRVKHARATLNTDLADVCTEDLAP